MELRTKLQEWADELRAIAQNGFLFAASEQDETNYISTTWYSCASPSTTRSRRSAKRP